MSVPRHHLEKTGNGSSASQVPGQAEQFADSGESSVTPDPARRQLVAALKQQGALLRKCSLLTDKVTALENALAKASQFANYDELTGLPNRRLLLDRFIQAVAFADRHRQGLALLFFDVNDFKRVNDELGHDAGDRLLQQIARRLSASVRGSDTACRYGGDEFVTLLTEITHGDDVLKALRKIRAELAPAYVIDRRCIRVTVSDGLVIYPSDAQRFTDLMRLADHSMLGNKSGRRFQSGGLPTSRIPLRDTRHGPKPASLPASRETQMPRQSIRL